VLVVPDLEAGNMLAQSVTFLADADAAGIVLGARDVFDLDAARSGRWP
jgi:phosphate acetyltransferase